MRVEPSSTHSPRFNRPVAVPSTEELRSQALNASWQRDRRVARRRLAWRWAWWYTRQYAWILALLTALLAAVWHWWPAPRSTSAQTLSSVPMNPGARTEQAASDEPLTLTSEKRLHTKEP